MYRKIYNSANQLAESIRQGVGPAPETQTSLKGLGARSHAQAAKGIIEGSEDTSYKETLGKTLEQIQRENMELRAYLENGGESPPVRPLAKGEFRGKYSTKGKNAGYAEGVTKEVILSIVEQEAVLRGIDPEVAKTVVAAEGLSAFQSQFIMKSGNQERSYGPMQLFIDGGLGNEYQKLTGRSLPTENHLEGITNQIRFGLDKAVNSGWTPWYGAKAKGISARQGLEGSRVVGNWKGN